MITRVIFSEAFNTSYDVGSILKEICMAEKVSSPAPAAGKGLQNVVVGQTKLSLVNGTEGKLIYAGYKIEDLAEHATFEEVIYLLWHLKLPTKSELDGLTKALHAEMALSPEI